MYLYRFTMNMFKQNIQLHHCHRANEFYILLLVVICNYMAVYNMGMTYLTKRKTIPLWFLFITYIYLDKRSGMCPPHVHTKWNLFNKILYYPQERQLFVSYHNHCIWVLHLSKYQFMKKNQNYSLYLISKVLFAEHHCLLYIVTIHRQLFFKLLINNSIVIKCSVF